MSRHSLATRWQRFRRDRGGATAVEFALIAPLLIALSAAILEFLLLFSDYQTADEATRRGVRAALIADSLTTLGTLDAINSTPIECRWSGTVTCTGGTVSTDADTIFQAIVADMQAILPTIRLSDVRIRYSQGGVDSDPDGPLKTPLITIWLDNVQHNVLYIDNLLGLQTTWTLPSFNSSRMSHTRIVPS